MSDFRIVKIINTFEKKNIKNTVLKSEDLWLGLLPHISSDLKRLANFFEISLLTLKCLAVKTHKLWRTKMAV